MPSWVHLYDQMMEDRDGGGLEARREGCDGIRGRLLVVSWGETGSPVELRTECVREAGSRYKGR